MLLSFRKVIPIINCNNNRRLTIFGKLLRNYTSPANNFIQNQNSVVINTLRDFESGKDKDHDNKKLPFRKKLNKNSAAAASRDALLIECKRSEFNLLKNCTFYEPNFQELASHGWENRKSNGDYFLIHRTDQVCEVETKTEDCTFKNMNFHPVIENWLHTKQYNMPTEIQQLSMKPIMEGSNVLLAAETGCGKTLAYLLPLMNQLVSWVPLIERENVINSPLAIVVTPSRELTLQIGDIAEDIGKQLSLNVSVLTGGGIRSKGMCMKNIQSDLIIASFGALKKLTATRKINLSQVRHVVIDEADTLLDDSFNDEMKKFLHKINFHYRSTRRNNEIPIGAQLTLASATMPKEIGPLFADILPEDSMVKLETKQLHHILRNVSQKFIRIGRKHRGEEILKIVKSFGENRPTIIFSNKSSTCDWVSLFLNEFNIKCVNFNGEMHRVLRAGKFQQYQDGTVNFLSTTDIGSRGLDTTRAEVIINFDFPMYIADYIHRCGRVGRQGSQKPGQVINFVCNPYEARLVQAIEIALRSGEPLPNVNGNIPRIRMNSELHKLNREMKILNK